MRKTRVDSSSRRAKRKNKRKMTAGIGCGRRHEPNSSFRLNPPPNHVPWLHVRKEKKTRNPAASPPHAASLTKNARQVKIHPQGQKRYPQINGPGTFYSLAGRGSPDYLANILNKGGPAPFVLISRGIRAGQGFSNILRNFSKSP
jgi:hypothetical protein